ncbi:hypothetical protein HSBAA_40720 [Vreelandella sulfidaeris]|uniref:Uncharacterized protein n=1 Tax=Vreelandella sulfidaeris TaxID=115553 RepID=A0A455U9A2_9GAMM|nr:hypothetical protein HSBAA_40720 [Halomonas sulfidaeris]
MRGYLLCQEAPKAVDTALPLVGEFEHLLSQQPVHYDFPTFDENAVATLSIPLVLRVIPKVFSSPIAN